MGFWGGQAGLGRSMEAPRVRDRELFEVNIMDQKTGDFIADLESCRREIDQASLTNTRLVMAGLALLIMAVCQRTILNYVIVEKLLERAGIKKFVVIMFLRQF